MTRSLQVVLAAMAPFTAAFALDVDPPAAGPQPSPAARQAELHGDGNARGGALRIQDEGIA